jgi:hypothetical protein
VLRALHRVDGEYALASFAKGGVVRQFWDRIGLVESEGGCAVFRVSVVADFGVGAGRDARLEVLRGASRGRPGASLVTRNLRSLGGRARSPADSTALDDDALTLAEAFSQEARTAPDGNRRLTPTDPANLRPPVGLSTPSYLLSSQTQGFMGLYIGAQFGP